MPTKRITAASQFTDSVECSSGYVSISIVPNVAFDATIVLQRKLPCEGSSAWRTFATYDGDIAVEETSQRMGGTWDVRAGASAYTSGTVDVTVAC